MKQLPLLALCFMAINAKAQNKKVIIYGVISVKEVVSKLDQKTKKYRHDTIISPTTAASVSVKNHPNINTFGDIDGNYKLDISSLADTTKNIVITYDWIPVRKEIVLKKMPKKSKKINVVLPCPDEIPAVAHTPSDYQRGIKRKIQGTWNKGRYDTITKTIKSRDFLFDAENMTLIFENSKITKINDCGDCYRRPTLIGLFTIKQDELYINYSRNVMNKEIIISESYKIIKLTETELIIIRTDIDGITANQYYIKQP